MCAEDLTSICVVHDLITRIKNLSKRPFVRNVFVVASGTAASQAITMAFAPIITRLYGPEAFGLQGLFVAIVGIMSTFAALSYPTAIVLTKTDADAIGLARLSIHIGLLVSIISLVLLLLFGDNLLALLNAEGISDFIYLIPLAMFSSVLSGVMGQWLIRKKTFALASKLTVLVTSISNLAKAGFGYIHPNALTLIVINTLNGLASATLMFIGWKKFNYRQEIALECDSKKGMNSWGLAKRHYDFALYRTPQNLINAISQSLPIMMLATYFGSASAGYYTIALTVLGIPASLIGTSVMQVFYPKVNEAFRAGANVKRLIVKTTMGMAVTGALPFAVVITAGPWLFAFVFGEEWRVAGVYAQWLSPWLFLQYINKPAVSAIPALNLQGGLLIYELFSTGTKVLGLYIGYAWFKSDVVAIALFSISGIAAYAWLIFWVIKHSEKKQQLEMVSDAV